MPEITKDNFVNYIKYLRRNNDLNKIKNPHGIKIVMDAVGSGCLIIDGHDVSRYATSIDFSVNAGEFTTLNVKFHCPEGIEIISDIQETALENIFLITDNEGNTRQFKEIFE